MSKVNNDMFREVQVLSQKVSKKIRLLANTACMNTEQRELYAFLEMYAELTGDHSLDHFKKIVQLWGRGLWGRTELTDLGLAIGDPTRTEDFTK